MKHEYIIGMYYYYEYTNIVTYNELKELFWWRNLSYKFDAYFDKRKNTELTRFDYCPYCSKKIDWNELKRRCKNDR